MHFELDGSPRHQQNKCNAGACFVTVVGAGLAAATYWGHLPFLLLPAGLCMAIAALTWIGLHGLRELLRHCRMF